MLKKIYRLSSVRLVGQKKINGKHFSAKYSENKLPHARFGFVISKKLSKSAVVRNSLKRKLSVSIEEIFDKIVTGVDIVIYPRQSAIDISQKDLEFDIKKALGSENLLK